LVLAGFGAISCGFLHATAFSYAMQTVAFAEMIKLQSRHDKEQKIQIKTKWVEWYLYFAF